MPRGIHAPRCASSFWNSNISTGGRIDACQGRGIRGTRVNNEGEKRTYRRGGDVSPWRPRWLPTILRSIPLALVHPFTGRGAIPVSVARTGSCTNVARSSTRSLSLPHTSGRRRRSARSRSSPLPYSATPPSRAASLSLLLLPRRQWRGAGERSQTTVLPRIAEVASYDVPCAPMSPVVSSRRESTAYNFRETRSTVSPAWHGRSAYARQGGGKEGGRERERDGEREIKQRRRTERRRNWPRRSLVASRPSTTLPPCCFLAAGDPSGFSPFVGVPARYAPNFTLSLFLSARNSRVRVRVHRQIVRLAGAWRVVLLLQQSHVNTSVNTSRAAGDKQAGTWSVRIARSNSTDATTLPTNESATIADWRADVT